jgi:hypothetical protein
VVIVNGNINAIIKCIVKIVLWKVVVMRPCSINVCFFYLPDCVVKNRDYIVKLTGSVK